MSTPNAPAWWVESQRETTEVTGAGRLVTGVEVTYSTRGGHTGTVFIPDSTYAHLDQVKATIQAAADHADAVANLSADGGGS